MKNEHQEVNKLQKPDELQREIWQYRRIWLTAIVILIAGRFLLPHLRNLHGWEQKVTLATVEIAKSETPPNAVRVSSTEEASAALMPGLKLSPYTLQMEGPSVVAVWDCMILSEKASCLRYYYKTQPLTMAIFNQGKNKQEIHDPFAKSGWSGYFIIHKGIVMILVGVIEAEEIKNMWPFVRDLALPK